MKLNKQTWSITIAACLLIAGGGGLLGAWHQRQSLSPPGLKLGNQPLKNEAGKIVSTNTIELPLAVANYISEPLPVTQLELDWLPKDTTFGRRLYTAPDGFQVMISAVMMGTDRTSIHKPDYCLVGQGWSITKREFVSVPMLKPKAYELPVQKLTTIRQIRGQSGTTSDLLGVYGYWFAGDERITSEEKQRTWLTIKELVGRGRLQRWSYVTYFAICPPGQEPATWERMKKFIAESVPHFQLASGPKVVSKYP